MKQKAKMSCQNHDEVIPAKHVFSENNQVFEKQASGDHDHYHQWCAINFQWLPLVELNKKMNHPLNQLFK